MAPVSSLAAFYMLAESAQGRSRWGALLMLPALIALGAGLAPHLTAAVNDGLKNKAGEFVRTPKHGTDRWRYLSAIKLPVMEILCGLLSLTAVVLSLRTGHYFATPFATLFMLGYSYIAALVIGEQLARRRHVATADPALETGRVSGEVAKAGATAGAVADLAA
jgi:hypothetical protein